MHLSADAGLTMTVFTAEPCKPSHTLYLLVSWAATLDQARLPAGWTDLDRHRQERSPIPVPAPGSPVVALWSRRALGFGMTDGPVLRRKGDPGASDKPSDNGSRQRPTQRDVPRHRYPSELR